MKQEGEILKRCGKGNPFRTPEGYFDRFHEDLMKKISGAADVSGASRLSPGSSAPRRAEAGLSCLGKTSFAVLFRNVSVYWRIAAVLVVAVSLSCFIYLQGEGSKAQDPVSYRVAVSNDEEYTDEEINVIIEESCLDDYDLYQLVSDAK